MDEINGKRMQELFQSEQVRNHFTSLANTLGFALSVYSSSGSPLWDGASPYPECGRLQAFSACPLARDTGCYSEMMDTLAKGTPRVFTCYGKMTSFAVPIEYMDEKAVIFGHGAFSSRDHYREHLNLLGFRDPDAVNIPEPEIYISDMQARKACNLVSESARGLLRAEQETVSLRRKIEALKDVFGQWNASPDDQPAALYRSLAERLFALLDIDCLAVFTADRRKGRYTSLYSLRTRADTAAVQDIDDNDAVVRDLSAGKMYALRPAKGAEQRADASVRSTAWYFPVVVNSALEAILAVFNRVLRDDDINIISAFCRQAAFLIENRRLYRDLLMKSNRLAAASTWPVNITHRQDYKGLVQAILDKSAELLTAEQGTLMLIDQVTEALLVEAKKGTGDSIPERLAIPKGQGIAGRVAVLGEPVLVKNLEEDPRFKQKSRRHYRTPSFVSVPLKIEDRIIGVLNLSDKATGEVFDDEDLKLIQAFATHAAIVLDWTSLYNQTEELKRLSITDPLTGLLNRRYLQDRLEEELARSKRHDRVLCLLMMDLDGFKYYNDTYGHLLGDRILKSTAEVIMKSVRTMDVVSRYGGDEFVIIFPETELAVATSIAHRLGDDISKKVLAAESSVRESDRTITASIGIVTYPRDGTTTTKLLDNADKAMYRAKYAGKNKIEAM